MKTNNTYLWRTGIYCCSAITVISLLNTSNVPGWANQHSPDSSSLQSAPIPGTIGRDYISKNPKPSKEEHTTIAGRAYTPVNPKPSEEKHTTIGGRRCGNKLVVLAPRKNIGTTISERPTFMWYVEGESTNKQDFYLYRYNSQGKKEEIFHDDGLASSQVGINSYTLAQNSPALEVGQTYIWQIVQHCKKNIFDGATSASIKRIAPTSSLMQLSNDSVQKAKNYARSGIWYDALASVSHSSNAEDKQFQKVLLHDLANLEPDLEADETTPLGFTFNP